MAQRGSGMKIMLKILNTRINAGGYSTAAKGGSIRYPGTV
jgi:hypothetical protein